MPLRDEIKNHEPRPASGPKNSKTKHGFVPAEPTAFHDVHLNEALVESLVLKSLLNLGSSSGRRMAEQLKLPLGMLSDVFLKLCTQMLLSPKRDAPMNDYEYELSKEGFERARRHSEQCTYFGAMPVSLDEYTDSVNKQSVRQAKPRLPDLMMAFKDLILPKAMLSQIGQAVNAGRGLFLYGPPGNGKSSIAERVMDCISEAIWIPRAITVGREVIRIYDPSCHEALPLDDTDSFSMKSKIDKRWVRVRRPTVVVGGELTLDNLEITYNPVTGITEAPMQLKSNCGALVIDDLGRQRCSVIELLNRWIIPLEKGIDFVSLPSGRQIKIPFDQLLVFATNLEPQDLVDASFLRRIPYKIEVVDPTEDAFRALFNKLAPEFKFEARPQSINYLIERHFTNKDRPLRYCYARDILEQAKNFCEFHERPYELTNDTIDTAVTNYFAGL